MTKIEWTNESWSPVTGCTKISEGCKNCYAERMSHRLKGRFGYPEENPFTPTFHSDRLREPLSWKKPKMVFVCSMGDLFHEEISFEMVNAVFSAMSDADHHTYQVLTKRPWRMLKYFNIKSDQHGIPWQPKNNVWIGVTAENQEQANIRIPILLQTHAAVRFVSCEPLLSPINLKNYLSPLEGGGRRPGGINWVIAGGESGHGARPMHPDWPRSLRDQCQATGVPFFFKQWGEYIPWEAGKDKSSQYFSQNDKILLSDEHDFIEKLEFEKVGKKSAGRLLDGEEWGQYPEIKTNPTQTASQ